MRRTVALGMWRNQPVKCPVDWETDPRFEWLWKAEPRHIRIIR